MFLYIHTHTSFIYIYIYICMYSHTHIKYSSMRQKIPYHLVENERSETLEHFNGEGNI